MAAITDGAMDLNALLNYELRISFGPLSGVLSSILNELKEHKSKIDDLTASGKACIEHDESNMRRLDLVQARLDTATHKCNFDETAFAEMLSKLANIEASQAAKESHERGLLETLEAQRVELHELRSTMLLSTRADSGTAGSSEELSADMVKLRLDVAALQSQLASLQASTMSTAVIECASLLPQPNPAEDSISTVRMEAAEAGLAVAQARLDALEGRMKAAFATPAPQPQQPLPAKQRPSLLASPPASAAVEPPSARAALREGDPSPSSMGALAAVAAALGVAFGGEEGTADSTVHSDGSATAAVLRGIASRAHTLAPLSSVHRLESEAMARQTDMDRRVAALEARLGDLRAPPGPAAPAVAAAGSLVVVDTAHGDLSNGLKPLPRVGSSRVSLLCPPADAAAPSQAPSPRAPPIAAAGNAAELAALHKAVADARCAAVEGDCDLREAKADRRELAEVQAALLELRRRVVMGQGTVAPPGGRPLSGRPASAGSRATPAGDAPSSSSSGSSGGGDVTSLHASFTGRQLLRGLKCLACDSALPQGVERERGWPHVAPHGPTVTLPPLDPDGGRLPQQPRPPRSAGAAGGTGAPHGQHERSRSASPEDAWEARGSDAAEGVQPHSQYHHLRSGGLMRRPLPERPQTSNGERDPSRGRGGGHHGAGRGDSGRAGGRYPRSGSLRARWFTATGAGFHHYAGTTGAQTATTLLPPALRHDVEATLSVRPLAAWPWGSEAGSAGADSAAADAELAAASGGRPVSRHRLRSRSPSGGRRPVSALPSSSIYTYRMPSVQPSPPSHAR